MPMSNDQFIRRSLMPYAIAAKQLQHYRDAASTSVGQGYRRYNREQRGQQRMYNRQRSRIPGMISNQMTEVGGTLGAANQAGTADLAAQGFSGTNQMGAAFNNAQNLSQGLGSRQRSFFADTRASDAAYSRDVRNTGGILRQAGRTSIQQAYMDAMAQMFLERMQTQLQLRNQLAMEERYR